MLLSPAAMASSHGPVQVTGKQLKSALLPASDFVAGGHQATQIVEYDADSRIPGPPLAVQVRESFHWRPRTRPQKYIEK